ncbi:beta-N-acetylhexosaminidase [Marchantia polymorpha subsp. ruderalis]|uniref:Glycoside hydrolase family 3 N-terminal domain-containing protein n=2 Tax=Marchantia polymorpha TaxID=3197 RepID=A0AAF6C130_MARPO|nr:hypothetical protein MARPO_0102s0003 [Marchantia polymorpha]BBN17964.1 hypothetical protein Mp_7g18370 [Marchantia polymorpha subsp. ruderalis]|eukprot:PTQ32126.1 hypothetical protein MARPO_0102s0003 [Marchantia polymorpha]
MAQDRMENPFQVLKQEIDVHKSSDLPDVPKLSFLRQGSKYNPPVDFDENVMRRRVAKLIVFGFYGKSVNSHARELISHGAGGVIIFRRNVEDPFQVAELCAELKQEAGDRHLITMVDQEGGRVQRVGPPLTSLPSARRVGLTGDSKAAGAIGSVVGKELRALHIDMNLAPVLDVDIKPSNPVLLGRSFGTSPELVAEFGYEFIRGQQREGVAACAKHYPGMGNISIDSHLELPLISSDLDHLTKTDMPPFQKAVEADTAAVMVGHVIVSSFTGSESDESSFLPASLNTPVIQFLRNQFLFEGLIMTDCLEMGAIAKHYTVEDAAVQALLAGADMLLVCHTRAVQLRVIDRLTEAVRKGILPLDRIEEAGQRVDDLANTYCRKAPSSRAGFEHDYHVEMMELIGCKEHQIIVANVLHHIALAEAFSKMETSK